MVLYLEFYMMDTSCLKTCNISNILNTGSSLCSIKYFSIISPHLNGEADIHKGMHVGVVRSSTTHQGAQEESGRPVHLAVGREPWYGLWNKQSSRAAHVPQPLLLKSKPNKNPWKLLTCTENH